MSITIHLERRKHLTKTLFGRGLWLALRHGNQDDLIVEPRFELDVLMIQEDEIRRNDGKGSWFRRGYSLRDRKLIAIVDTVLFRDKRDLGRFLPEGLEEPFSNHVLAKRLEIPIHTIRKMTYCLRKMGLIVQVGKRRFVRARRDPAAVLDGGVWAACRHPNYLGEVLFWWGLWLSGVAAAPAWAWTAAGPLAITLLFVRVSVPWMDRRMAARHPAYLARLRTTPALVPWPRPRR